MLAELPEETLARAAVRLNHPRREIGEKYWSLSGFPSHSLESRGGAFLIVIFGQIFAYSAFSDSHFSRLGVGLDRVDRAFRLADPAIDAFVRVDDEHVFALVEAVHRAHVDAVHGFAANAALIHDVGQLASSQQIVVLNSFRLNRAHRFDELMMRRPEVFRPQ